MTIQKCRICNSEKLKVIKRLAHHKLIECKTCGIIFLDPFPESNKVKKQYEKDDLRNSQYYESNRPYDIISFAKRWKIIEDVIKKRPKKILDYGCSTGNFIEASKIRGYKVQGKELNKRSIEICKSKGFDVSSKISARDFDLIHAGDLIEHVTDPREFLTEVTDYLKPKGHLVISTPDFGNIFAHKIQIKPAEHLYYFTRKSMKRLLEEKGYKVVYIKGFSRKRSIKNLVYSSTSKIGGAGTLLKLFNGLKVHHLIDPIISNMNDDMLVIAKKN